MKQFKPMRQSSGMSRRQEMLRIRSHSIIQAENWEVFDRVQRTVCKGILSDFLNVERLMTAAKTAEGLDAAEDALIALDDKLRAQASALGYLWHKIGAQKVDMMKKPDPLGEEATWDL